jgi:hypothetical protein
VLCLATHNLLPPPAQVLGAAPRQPDFTIGRAAFHARAARVAQVDGDLPVLKRSDNAGFEVDFTLARAQPLTAAEAGGPTVDRRQHPGAVQVGYIEVFMAAAGRIKNLQPAKGDIRENVGGVPPLIAWRQRRRLVVPSLLPLHANGYTTRLRAAVPLLMEPDARLGRTNVWVRIVTSEHDSTRPWQRIGDVILGEE